MAHEFKKFVWFLDMHSDAVKGHEEAVVEFLKKHYPSVPFFGRFLVNAYTGERERTGSFGKNLYWCGDDDNEGDEITPVFKDGEVVDFQLVGLDGEE